MTALQLRSKIQHLSLSQRMKTCGRPIAGKIDFVALNYAEKTSVVTLGRASCRSVLCPCCRMGQMVKRKSEVQTIIDSWKADYKSVSMLTFTAPHDARTAPGDFFGDTSTRKGLSGAIALLKQSQFWKETIRGYVSVLESTFGKNGVHAHYHIVVATDEPINDKFLAISELWQAVCVRAGLGMPSIDRGLTVQNAHQIAQYISKWSIQSEMAGAHVKGAKNGNMTLVDLEQAAASGASWAKKLLRSYYKFMYRRRNITYSRNLSDLRAAHKEHVDSLWSLVPVFSVDRKQSKLSCQDEQEIKEVLSASDFGQESIDLLSESFNFVPEYPDFDKSTTPESRHDYRLLIEEINQDFYNIKVLLDVVPNVTKKSESQVPFAGAIHGPLSPWHILS